MAFCCWMCRGILEPGVRAAAPAWGPGASLELGWMQGPRSSGLSLVDRCVVTRFGVTLPLGLPSRKGEGQK